MPLSRLVARPMTQTDAYRAGRGLTRRLADPRRRRSRAVLLAPHQHEKSSLSRRQRSQPRPLLPRTTRTYTRTHRGRGHKGCHHHNTKRAAWLPQDPRRPRHDANA